MDVAAVQTEASIVGEQPELLSMCLCDQHPVERVGVQHGQFGGGFGVFLGDGQGQDAAAQGRSRDIVWADRELAQFELDSHLPD